MHMRLPFILALGLLAACQEPAEPAGEPAPAASAAPAPASTSPATGAQTPAAAAATVALDAEGLRFVARDTGSTALLAFGTPRAQVEQAMAAALPGTTPRASQFAECGAGLMGFADYRGLTLNYQGEEFVGWFAQEGARPATMNSIAVGMDRAALEDSGSAVVMIEDGTLGAEFTLGNDQPAIGGFLSGPGGEAIVTGLYAGTNCFFR